MHKFLIHKRGDHVGVATSDIAAGESVIGVYMDDESTVEVPARSDVPLGHKIAVGSLDESDPVLEYGVQIAKATADIEVGDHVHTHNIKSARW